MSELLEIKLSNFEGPLDLLIHLIYKNEMNIYDISISKVTEDFVNTINKMKEMDIEVAAEFINMASYLIYLKSRMLLPRDSVFAEEELDPEEEKYLFTQRLIEYSFYKDVAVFLKEKEMFSSRYLVRSDTIFLPKEEVDREDPYRLASLFFNMMTKEKEQTIVMERDAVDPQQMMERVKAFVFDKVETFWSELIKDMPTRRHIAVAILAILELARLRLINVVQNDNFGDIMLSKTAETSGGQQLYG